jgi:ribonucleoside-diphosphate reductase alpha chain
VTRSKAPPRRRLELDLTPNARVVLERRYLAKDASGQPVETPADLFRRVAANIAGAERAYGPRETAARRVADW